MASEFNITFKKKNKKSVLVITVFTLITSTAGRSGTVLRASDNILSSE